MNITNNQVVLVCVGLFFCMSQAKAQGTNLVPDVPSTAPDYFCTWNLQGFACSYSGASPQADMMIESSLFGTGTNQNWLGFYPEVRADLTFLLDDAFDFPIGGGHNDTRRGSIELDSARFPSYKGTPAERLATLSKDVKAKGWRDLGLWICNSRPNVDELKIDSETYWCERLKWSQDAGIGNWKVDWGIGLPNKPLWKFKLTPKVRAAAPDIWIEQGGSGAVGDLYRTYDVGITVSIPETIRRIAAFLKKEDPKDRRLITCEDEVYIGAGTGCSYGIMRHPLTDNMPNGKPDRCFMPGFRDVKHRMDEVVRAVRWHRIAQPFPKGDAFIVDATELNDSKSKPTPARIARGGLALPIVTMPDNSKEPPYVLCSRHPDGEIAVATIPRNIVTTGGKAGIVFPLADISIDVGGELNRPTGIFGEYASLTFVTTSDLSGKKILAQDLAGNTPVDITTEVKKEKGRLVIPGAVIHRVGLMAGKPGDVSDPGLVLVIEGLTTFIPKKPMKPGMYMESPRLMADRASVQEEAQAQLLKISHIAVQATNVEQSVAFYRDFLGLAEASRLKNKDDGSLMLVNFRVSKDQWIEVFDAAKLKPGRDRICQIAFRVADAEALRARLAGAGLKVPDKCPTGQLKNLNFTVQDPSNYTIEFVQYMPEGWPLCESGQSMPESRVSELITHAGVAVSNVAAANCFYGDLLGMKESWRGSSKGDVVSWLHMRIPPAGSYVEYMLEKKVTPHFCLEVADMAKAVAKLEASAYRKLYLKPVEPIVGKNRRRLLNLYDPNGIRVELMEPNTVDGQPAPPTEAPLPVL